MMFFGDNTRTARFARRARSTRRLVWILVFTSLGSLACTLGPSSRSLHYLDDQLVTSPPVHQAAYAAYLRARLAMEAQPADLERAVDEIAEAIEFAPREPHLWTTLAEVELQRGDREAAIKASRIALQLRPEYAPAQQLLVKLEGDATTTMSSRSRVRR